MSMIINKLLVLRQNKKYVLICSLFGLVLLMKNMYYKYCINITFSRLERLFPRKLIWEKQLHIYSISLSKFYTVKKKSRCVLLISGYRDIPYVWEKVTKYFESNLIDYYAPRTHGKGRSFFQSCDSADWVITYLEALKILEEQYEQVDIIAFSTGCVIALYLTQFEYKCRISNLILCAPFLIEYPDPVNYWVFSSKIAPILQPIINFFLPLRVKIPSFNYIYPRDTNCVEEGETDYYELAGFFELECKLFKFKRFRPKIILANNVVILYPSDDKVIGHIETQREIIQNAWGQPVSIITIPSYSNPSLPQKCGHVMFKEHPAIISNIIENIKKIIC